MVRDFYFFRHGQTEYNVQNKWQGSGIDAPLSIKGKEQVLNLAQKSCELSLTRLYSSPLIRAVQTANAISLYNNHMPITLLYNLRECYFGECEGLTFEESRRIYGDDFVDTILFPNKKNWKIYFPQGESKQAVFERVMHALRMMLLDFPPQREERVGIVCHAGVISALQCGLELEDVSYDNCSVLHIAYDTAYLKNDSHKRLWKQIMN